MTKRPTIDYAISFMKHRPGERFLPVEIINAMDLAMTDATLGRKLRERVVAVKEMEACLGQPASIGHIRKGKRERQQGTPLTEYWWEPEKGEGPPTLFDGVDKGDEPCQ